MKNQAIRSIWCKLSLEKSQNRPNQCWLSIEMKNWDLPPVTSANGSQWGLKYYQSIGVNGIHWIHEMRWNDVRCCASHVMKWSSWENQSDRKCLYCALYNPAYTLWPVYYTVYNPAYTLWHCEPTLHIVPTKQRLLLWFNCSPWIDLILTLPQPPPLE